MGQPSPLLSSLRLVEELVQYLEKEERVPTKGDIQTAYLQRKLDAIHKQVRQFQEGMKTLAQEETALFPDAPEALELSNQLKGRIEKLGQRWKTYKEILMAIREVLQGEAPAVDRGGERRKKFRRVGGDAKWKKL